MDVKKYFSPKIEDMAESTGKKKKDTPKQTLVKFQNLG